MKGELISLKERDPPLKGGLVREQGEKSVRVRLGSVTA